MRGEIETTDIFRGAFLLCSGCDLIDSQLNEGGQVVFFFQGDTAVDLNRRFSTGHGLVNPLQLRETLNMLRDMVFEKVRTEKRRRHHGYSTGRH